MPFSGFKARGGDRLLIVVLLVCAAAFAILMVGLPHDGTAVVRTRAANGTMIAWHHPRVEWFVDVTPNPALPMDRTIAVLEQSAASWNGVMQQCNAPKVVITPTPVSGKGLGRDGTNLIVWRLPGFCDDPANRLDAICLAPRDLASTDVFYSAGGEILETDMEINGQAPFSDEGAPDRFDLQANVTHEMGHALGLAHNCVESAGPVDVDGSPVPLCDPIDQLPPQSTIATMFPYHAPGDTHGRVPLVPEWQALCAAYAAGGAPSAAGCDLLAPSGRAGSGVFFAALSLFVAVVLAWRQRRRAGLVSVGNRADDQAG